MIRTTALVSVLAMLFAAPASLLAQSNALGSRNGFNLPAGYSNLDARARRALSERAVVFTGPIARDFVEALGEEAAVALLACSKPVAVKLAEFYASGQLERLPRPRDLLVVIAQPGHGDAVALWALQHGNELTDPDSFDVYLANPLEYALGLQRLAADAADMRVLRQVNGQLAAVDANAARAKPSPMDPGVLVVAGAVLGGAGLLLWRWRRRRQEM